MAGRYLKGGAKARDISLQCEGCVSWRDGERRGLWRGTVEGQGSFLEPKRWGVAARRTTATEASGCDVSQLTVTSLACRAR